MQFNATPQTLAQLDQVPLYKFGTALNMIDNMQSADQQTLADLPNSIAHQQAMRPMQQELLGIQNQQGLAQLPGMQADSAMRQRKNKEEDLFTPERHAEFYAKHGAEKMKQFADKLTNTGTVALNAASLAKKLPIGGNNAAKQMFSEAGIQWHPEWDMLPQATLVQRLHDLGTEFSTNGAKSQQMITQMQMKDEIARKTEEERTRRALEVEAMRTKTKISISEMTTAALATKNKENMQQAWTRLQAELRTTTDPELRQYLSSKIQEVFTAMERLQVNNKPTINPAVAPNVLQPGQQGSPAVVQPPAAGTSAPPKDPYAGFSIAPNK